MTITIKVHDVDITYSEDQIRDMFDNICDKNNWKNPIKAWVKAEDLELAQQSIEFFTATTAEAVQEVTADGIKYYKVVAPGYYGGPCN